MCARYQLTSDPRNLRQLKLSSDTYAGPFTGRLFWNIPPGTFVPAIYRIGETNYLEPAFWGFTVSTRNGVRRWVNIKSETIIKRGGEHQRCLIPATGFYEWEKLPGGEKQPWLFQIRESREIFLFAGVWTEWEMKGRVARTMAILTCPPNEMVTQVHDRQPVILDQEKGDQWLSGFNADLLQPVHRGRLQAVPLSTAINSVKVRDEKAVQAVKLNRPPLW